MAQPNWEYNDVDVKKEPGKIGRTATLKELNPEAKKAIKSLMPKESWRKAKELNLHPIQLHFSNLSFYVPVPRRKRKELGDWRPILTNVSGTFNPGSITAIMGSSGAGKTTLLNVLAGRAQGKIEGDILLNGHRREEAGTLEKFQVYVMQDDIMLASQTAEEMLLFSANLRLPRSFTPEQRATRVKDVLAELNIVKCKDTRVGAPGVKRGVSGGERKRISVGTELVINPSLVFLDEPTSGLDSFTAEVVISTMRKLAQNGRTVICTIHQPNSQIFALFDQLILMAKGQMTYFGPVAKAVDHFTNVGYPLPPLTNPADFYIKLIHIEQAVPESEERVNKLIQAFKESDMAAKGFNILIPLPEEDKKDPFGQPFHKQLGYIMKREVTDLVREPLKVRAFIGQTVFMAVLCGLVYLRLDKGQQSVQDRAGSLFFIIVNGAMGSMLRLVNTFPPERPVFLRESKNRMYSTLSYFSAKTITDLPFLILLPILFTAISYWMIGYKPEGGIYIMFNIVMVLAYFVGSSLGFILGIVAKDSTTAMTLVPMVFIPFMMFSGFLINADSIPYYFYPIRYTSFLKYSFEIIVYNEFKDLNFTCTTSEQIPTPSAYTGKAFTCPVENGEQQLTALGFDEIDIAANLLILSAMVVFYRIIAYLALLYRAKYSVSNA